jgi:pimeloyl-ACP methyl ester carboxylesterase
MGMPKIRIGGINLYYEMIGQGQPLLFIHGLGSSNRDWEKQAAFFSRDYLVVTFDVRGHGRSDKPPGPYSISLFANDTKELIKSLDLAPVHIVGLSMGGMIAFQLAASSPELLRSMVIVNSAPEFIIRTFRQRIELWKRLLVTRVLGMRKMAELLGRRLFPEPEQDELRRLIVERWGANDKQAYLHSLRALVGWSVADRLSDIRCPTLVVAADKDYTPVAFKKSYVSGIPDAELVVIADSRHATPLDQPNRFNEALAAFLSKRV